MSKENRVNCRCLAGQKLARKSDRPILADIQGEAETQKINGKCNTKLSKINKTETSIKSKASNKLPIITISETERSNQQPRLSCTKKPVKSPISTKITSRLSNGRPTAAKITSAKLTVSTSQKSLPSPINYAESTRISKSPCANSVILRGQSSFKSAKITQNSNHLVSTVQVNLPKGTKKEPSTMKCTQISNIRKSHILEKSEKSLNENKLISPALKISPNWASHDLQSKINSKDLVTTLANQQFVTLTQDSKDNSTFEASTNKFENIAFKRKTPFLEEDDKTFVNGNDFFKETHKPSSKKVVQPAVKTTLKAKIDQKKQIAFPLLFSPNYREDIIAYQFQNRKTFLLNFELVARYIDKNARTNLVNYLLSLEEFVGHFFEPTFYMAVRICDYSIVKLRLKENYYKLAGVVSLWIADKYMRNVGKLIHASEISAVLCKDVYSKEEVLSMERKILMAIDYCFNMANPLDFLNNYLKLSKLENDHVLYCGAKFIIECTSLFESYCIVAAPFIAAAALYMSHQTLKLEAVPIDFIWYNHKEIESFIDKVLRKNVQCVVRNEYKPFQRYLKSNRFNVASNFINMTEIVQNRGQ